jgi:Asparagine synthase
VTKQLPLRGHRRLAFVRWRQHQLGHVLHPLCLRGPGFPAPRARHAWPRIEALGPRVAFAAELRNLASCRRAWRGRRDAHDHFVSREHAAGSLGCPDPPPADLHLHTRSLPEFYTPVPSRAPLSVRRTFALTIRVIFLGEVWRMYVEGVLAVVSERMTRLPTAPPAAASAVSERCQAEALHIVILWRLGRGKGVLELLRALSDPQLRDREWHSPYSVASTTTNGTGHRRTRCLSAKARHRHRRLAYRQLGPRQVARAGRPDVDSSLSRAVSFFLDFDVMHLAFSRSPDRNKVQPGTWSWVMRQLSRLASCPRNRRPVQGCIPRALDVWFRARLHDMAHDLLIDPDLLASELFDRRAVHDFLDAHQAGRRNEELRTCNPLSLQMWNPVFRQGWQTSSADTPRHGEIQFGGLVA